MVPSPGRVPSVNKGFSLPARCESTEPQALSTLQSPAGLSLSLPSRHCSFEPGHKGFIIRPHLVSHFLLAT